MRRPHYWRPAGAASAPANILVFDTETWHGVRAKVAGGEFQTLRLGCFLSYRLERGRRTRSHEGVFHTGEQFWRAVRDRLDARRPLWVVAHNLPFDLGVVGGWGLVLSARCAWDRICVNSGVTFLSGTLDGFPVRLLDLCNYYHCSLASVGRSVGIPKMTMPDQSAGDDEWVRYCRNDVAVTAAGLDSLIDYVRTEQLGPWQPTIAGLAFSAYRSRFLYPKVLVHDVKPVLHLERAGYYGGLVEPAFVGSVPAPRVSETDVCSMYPSVCRETLPRRFEGFSDRLSVRDITRITGSYLVIADVRILSARNTYPVRLRSGTYHPVGSYRTVLPHPELLGALRAGDVVGVYGAAWYSGAPIFREYMDHFLAEKVAAHTVGDAARETLAKYLLNSLYGKTGQLAHRWREWDSRTMSVLEDHYRLKSGSLDDYTTGVPVVYGPQCYAHLPGVPEPLAVRDLWGRLEVQVPEGESRDSCPAVAATVTSYARVLLRRLQGVAGSGHWFYSDTDSVWVDDTGLRRLDDGGCISPGTPGKLDVKGRFARMVIYGPKDYETETCRRLKGVRPAAEPVGPGEWAQLQFPGALAQLHDNRPDGVFVRRVVKRLKREITRCVVTPSGATRPLRFPKECPECLED